MLKQILSYAEASKLKVPLILIIFVVFLAVPSFAAAEPQNTDPLQVYCQTKTKYGKRDCTGSGAGGLITGLRNAMTHLKACKKVQDDAKKLDKCIVDNGKKYLDKADATKPNKNENGKFAKALEKILDKEGLDRRQPDPGATQGQDPQATCGGSACTVSSPDTAACANRPDLEGCKSDANATCDDNACDLVQKYVNPVINVVTAVFGLVVVASLIMGGIQYSMAGGDSQKITNAKNRITMTLFALLGYAVFWSFLQFLVPGGVF